MIEPNEPLDIDKITPPPRKSLDIVCPLPVLFLCCVFLIGVLNMANFFSSYEKAIEEKPTNKQAALSSIETKYTSSFAGKTNYLDLNGLFSRMVDKKELNERFKLDNGYLVRLPGEVSIDYCVSNMSMFRDYLALYDIEFAFIHLPGVIQSDDDPMIPAGYETYLSRNADNLIAQIDENNINYLDFGTIIEEEEIDYYSLFYTTDHHWNALGAFWAHQYIVEYIDELLGVNCANPDYFDVNQYEIVTYENALLGSHGERTGINYAGLSDFFVITPKFETDIKSENMSERTVKEGAFEDVFLKDVIFTDGVIHYSNGGHSPYESGNYFCYQNNLVNNDFKILIVSDSYIRTIAPFLALYYGNIQAMRLNATSEQELIDRIDQFQPDIVLELIYDEEVSSEAGQKSFFTYLTAEALLELEESTLVS